MKTVVAILAHQSAQPTVDDFLPQWRKLPCDVIYYVPVGDSLERVSEYRQVGESAHSGAKVFRRFLDTLKDLAEMDYDHYVVAEYDTVNLRPELPTLYNNVITTFAVDAPPHNQSYGPMQLCLLSPWCFPRSLLIQFIAHAESDLSKEPDGAELAGLLDRWIGRVVDNSKLRFTTGGDMLGYPYHVGVHDRIRKLRLNWIHGWKSKAQFENVWPNE